MNNERETPYDAHEQRVCDYLQKIVPDIGCGNDPIGFLLASHGALSRDLQDLRQQLIAKETDRMALLRDMQRIAKAQGENAQIIAKDRLTLAGYASVWDVL